MGIPNAHTATTAERTTHTHTHTFFSNKVVTSMRSSETMGLISLRAKRVYRNGGASMRSSETKRGRRHSLVLTGTNRELYR